MTFVQKLWNHRGICATRAVSDYVGQLTFLLFLQMAGEQWQSPFNKPSPVSGEFA